MGLGDGIFDSGVEDAILKCVKDSEFFYADDIHHFLDLYDEDDLDAMETSLLYHGYSAAFHSLLALELSQMKQGLSFDPEKNPFMMKVTRLRLREKLLTTMEEVNGEEFQREKFTEEKAMEMVREAWEYEGKKKRCGSCNKRESACGEFSRCNRCKEIVYCGKECQVAHWKVHQKVCSKKK